MPRFTQHELLDLQEHIRGESATSQVCRQFSQMATDPDLKSFCEEEARTAEANVQKLMSLLNQGQAH
jgi:hypothetical protein